MNKKFLSAILFGALAVTSTGSFVSCKDYDDDIDNLQTQINGLASAKDLSDKISSLQTAITSAQSAAEAKAAAAQAVADAAKAAADKASSSADAASALVDALKATVADLEAKGATKEELDAAKAVISEAEASVLKAVEDAKAESKSADEVLAAAVEAAQEKADAAAEAAAEATAEAKTLATKVSELEAALEKAGGEAEVKALSEKVTALATEVKVLSENLGISSKRLTSVVFAPKTYINGIEAIKFLNLNYDDWSTDPKKWLANTADYKVNGTQVNNQVEDFGAKVEYMVSPDGVTMDGIKDVQFVLNDAKNTRAGVAAAKDVELTFIEKPEIVNGKLTGYVKKTFKNNKTYLPGTSYHYNYKDQYGDYQTTVNTSSENLIIASLKATIADNLKTAEEKDQEVAVFSDWTRVNETTGTPYIHQKNTSGHFYSYSQIYYDGKWSTDYRVAKSVEDKKFGPDAVYQSAKIIDNTIYTIWEVADNGIAYSQVYNEPLDLLSLVTVCVGHGNDIIDDYARYGLEFEFHLMDFKVKNQNQTVDNTNQKDFANLEGSILTSRNEDGTLTNNKVAVGRTPVIQAVLKDTKKNAVVDVRYFKIKWVEKALETKIWDKPYEKVAPWQCSVDNSYGNWVENYKVYILEDEMNDFYSKIVEGGIKKDAFRTQYPSMSQIYLGELTEAVKEDMLSLNVQHNYSNGGKYDDLKVGDNVYTAIGQASWQYDAWNDIQTQNILLNYTFINPRKDANKNGVEERNELAQAEQNFSKDAFFWFISADGTDRIFIPVKINVMKGKYAYAVEKEPAQWNTAKDVRIINPQLRSDEKYGNKNYTTTQMIGKLQAGYYKNVQNSSLKPMPATIAELVNHLNYDGSFDKAAASDIVFDASKLNTLPVRSIWYDNKMQDCSWYVTAGGKELHNALNTTPWAQTPTWVEDLTAAVIDVYGNIFLTDKDNTTNGKQYNEECNPNDASLLLVGKGVPVKVTAANCETSDFDAYTVEFLTPLKFNGLGDVLHVYDITNNGSTATITLGTISLQECFGMNNKSIYILEPVKPVAPEAPKKEDYTKDFAEGSIEWEAALTTFTADEKNFKDVILPAYAKQLDAYQKAKLAYSNDENTELRKWYGIQNLTVDLKNAKTDLLTGKFDTKLEDILKEGSTTSDPMAKYVLVMVDALGKPATASTMAAIRFDNLSGNAIQQPINIEIPVSVDTKWQKASTLKGVIKVTIHPTAK